MAKPEKRLQARKLRKQGKSIKEIAQKLKVSTSSVSLWGSDIKLDLTLSVTANISHEHRIDAIQKYWSEVTGVPLQSFNKPFFQKVKWKKKYDRPEEYCGVLRIRVKKSKDFLRKIDGWIEGIKKMNLE